MLALRSYIPQRPTERKVLLTPVEWLSLFVCNLITTVGIGGDIARHVTDVTSLTEPFLSGWHLVLYGGVMSVGLWLGVGVLRRGPSFVWQVPTVVIGFGLLSFAGLADSLWHATIGTEAEFEALVSPPHLLVMVGLVFLLASPAAILWHSPGRLKTGESLVMTASVTSTLIVAMMFTGFATVISGGMEFQRTTAFAAGSFVLPADEGSPSSVLSWVVGEDGSDLAIALGLATVMWTSVLFATALTAVYARFKPTHGTVLAPLALMAAVTLAVTGSLPTAAGYLALGAAAELTAWACRERTYRFRAVATTTLSVTAFWATQFLVLGQHRMWSTPLWTGSIVDGAIVAFVLANIATAKLTAPPEPTILEIETETILDGS